MVHCLPGIIAFLGYNSLPEVDDLIGKLKRLHGTLGLLARQIGINANTVSRWERGGRKPQGLHRKLTADLIRRAHAASP